MLMPKRTDLKKILIIRLSGVDTILSPEMKSAGEVMGIDSNLGMAFATKASSYIAEDMERYQVSLKGYNHLPFIQASSVVRETG